MSATPVPWLAHHRDRDWTCSPASTAPLDFHRTLEDYRATPLVDLPGLADRLEIGRLVAKDESARLGLGAFKGLGASWTVRRAVTAAEVSSDDVPLTVVAATDGNHGRAVARFARRLGHRATIVIPRGVHPVAAQHIVDERAELIRVDGSYDDAIDLARRIAARPGGVLVQDTAWDGYEEIPAAIIDGYATVFHEIDGQLEPDPPALVLVPTGVGSLLQAALVHYRSGTEPRRTAVVSVEPTAAACVQASLAAGDTVAVPTGTTIMAGLNCGTVSSLAWPHIRHGLDGAAAVDDASAVRAAHTLAAAGVDAGPCGAATLAALERLLLGPGHDDRRRHLGVGPGSTVVLLVTEGSAANPLPDH